MAIMHTSSRNIYGSERSEPKTRRGQRTRDSLVDAAREVLERDGYVDARISEIAAAAHVAEATFYTYFDSKESIFAELVRGLEDSMLNAHLEDHFAGEPGTDVVAAIDSTNRAYFLQYRQNARLMSVFEQVAQINPRFRQLQRHRGIVFADRTAHVIRRLQAEGRADPSLDAYATAIAINGMTGRMAYSVFVLDMPIEFEMMVRTVTRLWVNSLGLEKTAVVLTDE